MKKLISLGTTLVLALGLSLACGSDGSGDSGDGNGQGGGGFCQIGTLGCSCSGSFPCSEDGVECINGECIQCTPGDMGCVCDASGMCSSGTCTNPDPSCNLNCDPSTCN